MNRRRTDNAAGFTLAEVLAALLFMAIVVPVAMEGMRIASRAGSVAERKSVAVRLADSKLNELIVTGQWSVSGQEGDFGDRWPGYRWKVQIDPWTVDAMQVVTIEVAYPSQNQELSVRLSTLMNGGGL
jgi:type II secretion system protein I